MADFYNPKPLTDEDEQYRIVSDKGHYWSWCSGCGCMVICGTCGMNTCSGSSGELADGRECPNCVGARLIADNPYKAQRLKQLTYLTRLVSTLEQSRYSREGMMALARTADAEVLKETMGTTLGGQTVGKNGRTYLPTARYQQAIDEIFYFNEQVHEREQKELAELWDSVSKEAKDIDIPPVGSRIKIMKSGGGYLEVTAGQTYTVIRHVGNNRNTQDDYFWARNDGYRVQERRFGMQEEGERWVRLEKVGEGKGS